MKIVCIDNYDREYVSDRLIAENVSKYYGEIIVKYLNDCSPQNGADYFVLKPDDYKLYVFEP